MSDNMEAVERAITELLAAQSNFIDPRFALHRGEPDLLAKRNEARAALMDAIRAEIAKVREGINPNKVLCDDCPARWPVSLPAADARAGWATIESAPKDELILIGPTKRMGICAAMNHSREGWVTETCSDWVTIYTPTHWMPLPPPPRPDR